MSPTFDASWDMNQREIESTIEDDLARLTSATTTAPSLAATAGLAALTLVLTGLAMTEAAAIAITVVVRVAAAISIPVAIAEKLAAIAAVATLALMHGEFGNRAGLFLSAFDARQRRTYQRAMRGPSVVCALFMHNRRHRWLRRLGRTARRFCGRRRRRRSRRLRRCG